MYYKKEMNKLLHLILFLFLSSMTIRNVYVHEKIIFYINDTCYKYYKKIINVIIIYN